MNEIVSYAALPLAIPSISRSVVGDFCTVFEKMVKKPRSLLCEQFANPCIGSTSRLPRECTMANRRPDDSDDDLPPPSGRKNRKKNARRSVLPLVLLGIAALVFVTVAAIIAVRWSS